MAVAAPQKSRLWIWGVLVAVAIVLAFVLSRSRNEVPVRTAIVDREDLASNISTNSKVESLQDFQAHAQMASTIKALYVTLGQHVAAGQELIRLDASDAASKVAQAEATAAAGNLALRNMEHGGTAAEISTNRSDLATAELQAQAAASNLNTVEALQGKGAASTAEVAQARDKVSETSARVSALKATAQSRYTSSDISAQKETNSANASTLNAARSAYSNVDIRAPFAGTVYSVTVKASEFVPGPEEAMISIANLSKLQIRAYFDEPEIGKLAAGQAVKIVWDAKPDRVWHGHVTQPPTTVITYNGTRNVGECLISIDDADGDLLPNANVTVTVTTSQHNNVLSLPREALHTQGNEDYVFRIVNGTLVKTDVKVIANLTRIEILSGVKEGDRIALGGSEPGITLVDGMKVKTQP